jgi:hypothetical protein
MYFVAGVKTNKLFESIGARALPFMMRTEMDDSSLLTLMRHAFEFSDARNFIFIKISAASDFMRVTLGVLHFEQGGTFLQAGEFVLRGGFLHDEEWKFANYHRKLLPLAIFSIAKVFRAANPPHHVNNPAQVNSMPTFSRLNQQFPRSRRIE